MKKLNFSYHMQLIFETAAKDHNFTLRCFPPNDERQQILSEQIDIYPKNYCSTQTDSFGNRCIYGRAAWEHNYFSVDVNGTANIDTEKYIAADKNKTGIYRYFTALTKPGEGILGFYGLLNIGGGKNTDRAVYIMNKLFEYFKYKSGVTNISTTAEDACLLGVGVCQDYAHILLSLLRLEKIPCRYAAGMLLGEGATHAWVEIYDSGYWIPIDPTHNRAADDTYIRISSGRDARDCAINKGVFIGGGKQKQEVRVIVEEAL